MKIYQKYRTDKYAEELEREYQRLVIAMASFKVLKTPRPIRLEKNCLYTERLPGANSAKLKSKIPTLDLIDEYVKITELLWSEKLNCTEDLTPSWVREPKLILKKNLHPDFRDKPLEELRQVLSLKPDVVGEDYKVVHGDLCPVNIMMDESKQAYGLVDLGDLHMGDRRLDVAILSWTIRGNFGPEYEELYLSKLDIPIDYDIINYYRLIYDLSLPPYKDWSWIKA